MAVVPAQAGMSPSRAMEQRGCSRSPRAGGDEPLYDQMEKVQSG